MGSAKEEAVDGGVPRHPGFYSALIKPRQPELVSTGKEPLEPQDAQSRRAETKTKQQASS